MPVKCIPAFLKLIFLTLLIQIGLLLFFSSNGALAAIGSFSFCSCEDESAKKIDCDDSAVAVRCNINDNSWTPFELSTLRIEANNELRDNGSSKEISFFDSPIIIEAWGGKGGSGDDGGARETSCNGGSQGGRGYGRTTLDYIDFASSGIYIYLGKKGDSGQNSSANGGKGGSSTMIIGQPLEFVNDPCEFSEGCTPESQRVITIVGGGGGGGGCRNVCNINGRDGGNGACAIAVIGDSENVDGPRESCQRHIGRFGDPISAEGSDGSNLDNTGTGGNQDLDGSGSECFEGGEANTQNGKSGIGGRGGARNKNGNTYTDWVKTVDSEGNNEDLSEQVLTWMQGEGGTGDSSKAGAGGGGYGGACGGNTNKKQCSATGVKWGQGGGGGGGGTYVVGATASEEGYNLSFNELNSVNGGQVGILIGLIDTDDQAVGLGLIDAAQAIGEARGLGTADGSLEITAAYGIEGNTIDLSNTEITIGTGFVERGGELIPSITGITLSYSEGSVEASLNGLRAIFESDTNAPDVTVELDDTNEVLTMDFRAENLELLESLTCRDEEQTPIEFYLTLDDGVNEPLLLEVLGHWDCREGEDGSVDVLTLNSEETSRGAEVSSQGGGNCALAGSAQSPSSILLLLLVPMVIIIWNRFYRAINQRK